MLKAHDFMCSSKALGWQIGGLLGLTSLAVWCGYTRYHRTMDRGRITQTALSSPTLSQHSRTSVEGLVPRVSAFDARL